MINVLFLLHGFLMHCVKGVLSGTNIRMIFHPSLVTSTLVQFVIDTIWEMENLGMISTKSWLDPGHPTVSKVTALHTLGTDFFGVSSLEETNKSSPLVSVMHLYAHGHTESLLYHQSS